MVRRPAAAVATADKVIRVLSIDGGGIRGIIPARVLTYLELMSGKPISDLCHFIAGTSTGGIIASALAAPDPGNPGRAAHRAQDVLDLYVQRGSRMFRRDLWDRVTNPYGINDQLYDHEALVAELKLKFKDTLLSQARVELLVTSYDIWNRRPFYFKSWRAQPSYGTVVNGFRKVRGRKDEEVDLRDFPLWAVARATSAAPTYFEPAQVTSVGGGVLTLIDGGVFANNPAIVAYVAARRLYGEDAQIELVSLGTGTTVRPITYEKARDWGKVGWLQPVISVLMDGTADAANYQMQDLLGSRYTRFDITLEAVEGWAEPPSDDMDNVESDNIRRLQARADQLIADRKASGAFRGLDDLARDWSKPKALLPRLADPIA